MSQVQPGQQFLGKLERKKLEKPRSTETNIFLKKGIIGLETNNYSRMLKKGPRDDPDGDWFALWAALVLQYDQHQTPSHMFQTPPDMFQTQPDVLQTSPDMFQTPADTTRHLQTYSRHQQAIKLALLSYIFVALSWGTPLAHICRIWYPWKEL